MLTKITIAVLGLTTVLSLSAVAVLINDVAQWEQIAGEWRARAEQAAKDATNTAVYASLIGGTQRRCVDQ